MQAEPSTMRSSLMTKSAKAGAPGTSATRQARMTKKVWVVFISLSPIGLVMIDVGVLRIVRGVRAARETKREEATVR